MKAKLVFAILLLLPIAGTVERSPRQAPAQRAALRRLRARGNELFRLHRYAEAVGVYEQGHTQATRTHDNYSAARFLGNIGSCRFALLEYRAAMKAFLEARQLAEAAGDLEMVATACWNISSLYTQLGELNAGLQAAERGLQALRANGPARYAADMLTQAAVLRARQGDMEAALPLFGSAIREADGFADKVYARASAWEMIGWEFLDRRQLEAAERAFLEAFRLRKLARLPDLQYSFYDLGMLSVAKGAVSEACRFFSRAILEASRLPGALPLWRMHYQRGRALMALGKTAEALEELRNARDHVNRWRVELLPADSLRTNTAVEVQQVYSSFIAAANTLYRQTRDASLLRRSFHAAEENRAVGLRALLDAPSDWQGRLPGDYWKTLAELRQADAELVRRENVAGKARMNHLLGRLTEIETACGLDLPPADSGRPGDREVDSLARVRQGLHPGQAYLSFHLGDRESWLWAVTRKSVRLHRLPPRAGVASLVERFRDAIREGRAESEGLGEELHSGLLGSLSSSVRRQPHWLLALDDVLFELPFAALVTGRRGGRPAYLVEAHSLEIVPSGSLVASRLPHAWRGRFLGIGDPVYNTADPRWAGGSAGLGRKFLSILPTLEASSGTVGGLEMNRLPGSGREIRASAAVWGRTVPGPVFLEGWTATKARLFEALERNPSVVHIATHFVTLRHAREWGVWRAMDVTASGPASFRQTHVLQRGQALIALSLSPSGDAELLSPVEISRLRVRPDLVVLSGCSSAAADVLPGNGLMGMTHAWLASGSAAVAASLWPVPDDLAEFFTAFYSNLRTMHQEGLTSSAPVALELAQVQMLRGGGWRSLPRYWATYFCVGKG